MYHNEMMVSHQDATDPNQNPSSQALLQMKGDNVNNQYIQMQEESPEAVESTTTEAKDPVVPYDGITMEPRQNIMSLRTTNKLQELREKCFIRLSQQR